jgi:hypothetical protein
MLKVDDQEFESIRKFKYLRFTVTKDISNEIKQRFVMRS